MHNVEHPENNPGGRYVKFSFDEKFIVRAAARARLCACEPDGGQARFRWRMRAIEP
jgi:hypothetical protein